MKSKIVSKGPTRTQLVVYNALFIAISVVLKLLFEIYVPLGGFPSLRFNLTSIPIILGGIILGPESGFVIGIISDLLCYILKPNGPLFVGFTITNGLVGLIPGFLYRYLQPFNLKWIKWLNPVLSIIGICILLFSGALTFNNGVYYDGAPVSIWIVILMVLVILIFSVFPFISNLIFKKTQAEIDDRLLFIITIEQITTSMFLNTVWLSILYGQAWRVLLPARVITNIFLIPFYTIVVAILLNILKPITKNFNRG